MSYSTSNPPFCASQGIGGGRKLWIYTSTDAVTSVRVSGYFTNGYSLGMRAGDVVAVLDNDASPLTGAWCIVSASSKSGSTETVDLSDGVTITGTNSD